MALHPALMRQASTPIQQPLCEQASRLTAFGPLSTTAIH
jgi:hypothetical protein